MIWIALQVAGRRSSWPLKGTACCNLIPGSGHLSIQESDNRQFPLVEIHAIPYVPGVIEGSISRNPGNAGGILVVPGMALPAEILAEGVIAVEGAMFSHPMLTLLARGVPTVIMSAEQAAGLIDGELISLDGYSGIVRNLSSDTAFRAQLPVIPEPGESVLTADGVSISLRASVRNASGAALAKSMGAESIGLVRTEFLEPADGRKPDRRFYRQAFDELLMAAAPLDVTLRLIDIAADKLPAWMRASGQRVSVLGRQGIRLFGDEPLHGVMSAQLDALEETVAKERVKLLVPYITTLDEMQEIGDLIRSRVDRPIGAMIETPAAAMEIADHLEIADFVALGTNDLMQSLFAADRDDPALQHYLDAYAPVLYCFLKQIAKEAGSQLQRVQVCGLLSQLPGVFPLMLGLGFRAFSVDAAYIPYLASIVSKTHLNEASVLAREVCQMKRSSAVRTLLGVDAAPSVS
jgi:phosphoenolpyruvate-protein kinase (PTS system EI component)